MNLFCKIKLSKNIILANFSKKLIEPYKVTLNITNRCNSRCSICNIWKKQSSNELTPKEIKKIFNNLKTDWVNITGGEPFLRKDLVEIFSIIKKEVNPAVINVTTNGLLSKEINKTINKIMSLNFSQIIITISLNGPPEIHNNIRGVNNSWEKSIETFQLLKPLEKFNNIRVYFGYTICKDNLGYFKEAIVSVKKRIPRVQARDWHVNLFHVSSHYYNNSNHNEPLDQKKLLKEIKQVQEIKSFKIDPISLLENVFIKGIMEYVKTKKMPLPCSAIHSSCYIDPVGVVYPCIHYNKRLGELRENNYNLLNIWNSPEAEKVRDSILKKKCPTCWSACEANPSILNNIFKKSIKWMFQ